MAKLSKEEQEQLDALKAKLDAPDDDDTDDDTDGDDDAGVIVLRGGRADAFLAGLLGSGKSKKKQKPAGDDDTDDDTDGDDDDPPQKQTHRFFR